MTRTTFIAAVLLAGILFNATISQAADYKTYQIKIEESFPHDVCSYTQGLFFYGGELYESSGQYGESSFRKVDLKTGKVLRRVGFDRMYFAEGSCIVNDRLYVLTWREHVCFVYDIKSWKKIGTIRYLGEGWGLATDGDNLIMSDGTSTISFRDPESFSVRKTISVTLNGKPLDYLNELEYINGEIWANIYTTDLIARIDPATGNVNSLVNCSGLLPVSLRKPSTDVLNGIAYDPATGHIYLTGKYWPKLYRISVK